MKGVMAMVVSVVVGIGLIEIALYLTFVSVGPVDMILAVEGGLALTTYAIAAHFETKSFDEMTFALKLNDQMMRRITHEKGDRFERISRIVFTIFVVVMFAMVITAVGFKA